MAAGDAFPPLVVFHEDDRFWPAEGFHRLAAGLHASLGELPCDVRQGGLRDAILHSAGANAAHGLRRSNDDKRRAVLMLLQDEEWGEWNDRKIARACAVSHTFVSTVRSSYLATLPDSPRLVQRGGTVYQMKPRASSPKPPDPVPGAFRLGRGSVPAIGIASVVASVQQPIGYPRQDFPRHLAGGR